MTGNSKKSNRLLPGLAVFAGSFLALSLLFRPAGAVRFAVVLGISAAAGYFAWKKTGSRTSSAPEKETETQNGPMRTSERVGGRPAAREKKSYGEKIDPILEEGNLALTEMGRLYSTIRDPEIRKKINEIMLVTDKIMQDAVEDPTDIPQIRKFFRYYLPTTIKLLHAYDRMSSQGIEGENIDKSISNISEMLDVAIAAYKKRLDSLFENQALDIETDIDVMNQMLAREGLAGAPDFPAEPAAGTAAQQSSAAVAQQKG